MTIGFTDQVRARDHAVESVCAVLREQGRRIAARSYRAVKAGTRGRSAQSVSGTAVEGLTRGPAYIVDPATGWRRRTPEGLYWRRKTSAHLRRQGRRMSAGAVDRAMHDLGFRACAAAGSCSRPCRTRPLRKHLTRWNQTSPQPRRTNCGSPIPRIARTWSGFVYVTSIVDVYAQLIGSWHAATRKTVDLVEMPLRIANWERDRPADS